MSTPVLQIHEWSTTTPDTPGAGALLSGVRLSDADRELIAKLQKRSSLRITELRKGLAITVGPHIGAISLTSLRLVIMPKIKINNLMRMVAYAFHLSDLRTTETHTLYTSADHGLLDLLGVALLRATEHIARGGLLPNYEPRNEDLGTPRGRLDMRHIATHPRRATLRCTYEELTIDHELNQLLAAGLRLAQKLMHSLDLRLDLGRAADRLFGDLTRTPLDEQRLQSALQNLDRRSSHYRTALRLVWLIQQGAHLGEHTKVGTMPLSSFTLNMNMLFERFLERHLIENAPLGIRISAQDARTDVFTYLENSARWRQPTIRPDFVFHKHGQVIAVADAKYKNRHEHPPSTSELYQLTTYGLAYPMPEPRRVLLLHPISSSNVEHRTVLRFAPASTQQGVSIHLIGVPLDSILDGSTEGWWPLRSQHEKATAFGDSATPWPISTP